MCRPTYLPQDGIADKVNWGVERRVAECHWWGLKGGKCLNEQKLGSPDDRSNFVGTAPDCSACRFRRGRIDVIHLAIKLDGDGLALAEILVVLGLLRTGELEVGVR
jgi:hypothetical protein